ncbi:chondroitin sulfate proteoglycan 5 [Gastrophryne carolinensis]
MELWLRCWSLAALFCSLAADPNNGTSLFDADGQADEPHEVPAAEILASLLEKGVLDVEKASAWRTKDDSSWSIFKANKSQKKSQKSTSTAAPNSQNTGESGASGINTDKSCVGCGDDRYPNRKSPSRALLSEHSDGTAEPMAGFVWPIRRGTVDLELRKSFVKGDQPSMADSQEDSGSGDPHVKVPSSQVTLSSSPESEWNLQDVMDMATSSPHSTTGSSAMLSPSTEKAISPDIAEIDHLLPGFQEMSLQTPSLPTDGYEDGAIEEDDDDDLEEAEDLDDEITSKDIRNFPKAATLIPKIQTDEKPTGQQDFPRYHPEGGKDHTQTMAGTSENGTECRNGYIRRNNSCKSLCEIYPTYCYNGGQCYIVENIGAFCRCNTQDYIWHKGLRCESIITDFQVMCVAVGTAALVVLLLFMMTVFFAKKLYLLKTENYKLRKRNRYRTPSELHNDNFSLSTIAEGSHPNVRKLCDTPSNLSPHARALAYYDNVICQEDPNAPQKVQDLPKACLKDEEPFNIQNSISPKHECSKGDPDIVDVNCVLNNLT